MDTADETGRPGDDIVGQLSDAARDLIKAGRALLDGAERMLSESGRAEGASTEGTHTRVASTEQTLQRWVQLGQAAVAGFVEESSAGSERTGRAAPESDQDIEPIVGIKVTDNRADPEADPTTSPVDRNDDQDS